MNVFHINIFFVLTVECIHAGLSTSSFVDSLILLQHDDRCVNAKYCLIFPSSNAERWRIFDHVIHTKSAFSNSALLHLKHGIKYAITNCWFFSLSRGNKAGLISLVEGSELVRLVRIAVEKYLQESIIIKSEKDTLEKAGVFVTLNYVTRSRKEYLRGCIGLPLPEKPLYQGAIEAAIAAATEDPRFPPLDRQELDNIIFEVSVLTPPQQITASPADYGKEIQIGRDGLILHWRFGSGLLLPQVPVELNWDVDEYLANICYKAGAPPDVWLDPASKLYKFQAAVFKEVEPKGEVIGLEYDNNI